MAKAEMMFTPRRAYEIQGMTRCVPITVEDLNLQLRSYKYDEIHILGTRNSVLLDSTLDALQAHD